jgi:hypothetical protein
MFCLFKIQLHGIIFLMKEKYATGSIILGLLSLVSLIFAVYLGYSSSNNVPYGLSELFIPVVIFTPVSSLVGIMFGIMGLKNFKRSLSIKGIVFCSVVFIIFILTAYISWVLFKDFPATAFVGG